MTHQAQLICVATATNPEDVFATHTENETVLVVPFLFCEYWKPTKPHKRLFAIYHRNATKTEAAVSETAPFESEIFETPISNTSSQAVFDEIVNRLALAKFDLDAPLQLQAVTVPKPWGQEVWYTGIETRGVSMLESDGRTALLPYVLALAPRRLTANTQTSLVLLKILDPFAHETLGDLYSEMHTHKSEIYIVTKIDLSAWPNGIGTMFFGANPQKLAAIQNDEKRFRAEYLAAVHAYEKIRREIDNHLAKRENETTDLQIRAKNLTQLPKDLLQAERTARDHMESFLGKIEVREGDVIRVPTHVIHSLCHGIKVIEFQTQNYERNIVSFKQKVLTQTHWDSETAIANMLLASPETAKVITAKNTQSDRIVDFADFSAMRVRFQKDSIVTCECEGAPYVLFFAVEGDVKLTLNTRSLVLRAGQAAFVPTGAAVLSARLESGAQGTGLYAFPKIGT